MKWYIVVGRAFGSDEASALKIKSPTQDEAESHFRKEMRCSDDGDAIEDNDQPGGVWIDNVFECGSIEPKEV